MLNPDDSYLVQLFNEVKSAVSPRQDGVHKGGGGTAPSFILN